MPLFGNHDAAAVADAAEKFISKMNERDLARALEESEHTMSAQSRAFFVEAIFDAFRHRGESSEDAAEAAGTDVAAISAGNENAIRTLIEYAKSNSGLLKEAAIVMLEEHPSVADELSPSLTRGIAERLNNG